MIAPGQGWGYETAIGRAVILEEQVIGPDDADARAVAEVQSDWLEDRRLLAGHDRLHPPDFVGSFPGMHLPRHVIDKIYRRDAQAMFTGAWGRSH